MQQLGNRLKQLRLQHHFTQQQIAQQFGYAISAISSYESGQRTPSFEILLQYAKLFHVSTDYLLGVVSELPITPIEQQANTLDITGLSEEEVAAIKVLIRSIRRT